MSFKVIHLTWMGLSGWLIRSWIINEFENKFWKHSDRNTRDLYWQLYGRLGDLFVSASALDSRSRGLDLRPGWVVVLCCVPGNRTLLSQCLSPPRSVIGYWGIMREAWWNAGGKLVMDWQPIQGGVVKLPVTSFHHNFNKIWLDKPLGSSTDLTYLSCIKLFLMDYIKWKLGTLHEIEGILSLINTFLKLKFHFFKSRFSYILTFTLFTSVEWFTLPDKHCK